MYLKDIVSDFIVENESIECKSRLNREDILGWLKTVAGFANSNGGIFYLGVENKSFKLIGFDENDIDKEKLFFFNTIKEHIKTHLDIVVQVLPYLVNEKTRYILKISVMESKIKPVIINFKEMPLIYVRHDGFTGAATTEEIGDMVLNSTKLSFDQIETEFYFKKEDFNKFFAFAKERSGIEVTEKELAAINFFNDSKRLYNGSYLFSDKCENMNTKIVCTQYRGSNRGDNVILSTHEYIGNLLDGLNFAQNFIVSHSNHRIIKLADRHIDEFSYPKRAVFEALINSLAHRDYFIDGSQISIDLFPNRLVISSPGSFYSAKGKLDPTYNLSSFISKRRNKLICDIFVYLKVMEAKGSGFEKIVSDYQSQDENHKPFIFSKNNQFTIVLPDITYDDGVLLEEEAMQLLVPIKNQSKYDLKILKFCYGKYRTIKELCEFLGVSNSTYFRENIIKNLTSQEFLIGDDNGRSKSFIANKDLISLN